VGETDFQGVYIRFYEFGPDNAPGALQQVYFLAASDANLSHDSTGRVSANLSPAFWATGRHIISVQPVSNYWYWWSSNSGAPFGQSLYFRDLSAGQITWQKGDNQFLSYPKADVSFFLYGTLTEPGTIANLSASTLPTSWLAGNLWQQFRRQRSGSNWWPVGAPILLEQHTRCRVRAGAGAANDRRSTSWPHTDRC